MHPSASAMPGSCGMCGKNSDVGEERHAGTDRARGKKSLSPRGAGWGGLQARQSRSPRMLPSLVRPASRWRSRGFLPAARSHRRAVPRRGHGCDRAHRSEQDRMACRIELAPPGRRRFAGRRSSHPTARRGDQSAAARSRFAREAMRSVSRNAVVCRRKCVSTSTPGEGSPRSARAICVSNAEDSATATSTSLLIAPAAASLKFRSMPLDATSRSSSAETTPCNCRERAHRAGGLRSCAVNRAIEREDLSPIGRAAAAGRIHRQLVRAANRQAGLRPRAHAAAIASGSRCFACPLCTSRDSSRTSSAQAIPMKRRRSGPSPLRTAGRSRRSATLQ